MISFKKSRKLGPYLDFKEIYPIYLIFMKSNNHILFYKMRHFVRLKLPGNILDVFDLSVLYLLPAKHLDDTF